MWRAWLFPTDYNADYKLKIICPSRNIISPGQFNNCDIYLLLSKCNSVSVVLARFFVIDRGIFVFIAKVLWTLLSFNIFIAVYGKSYVICSTPWNLRHVLNETSKYIETSWFKEQYHYFTKFKPYFPTLPTHIKNRLYWKYQCITLKRTDTSEKPIHIL
jgi:hypothetical protein